MSEAKEEKPKVPEHIDKYLRMSEQTEEIIDTMELHHRQAYNAAVDKVLRETKTDKEGKEKKGRVKYALLKDEKKQEEFANIMSNFYVDKAKEYFKSNIDGKDQFEVDMLMNAYAGTTKTQLKRLVSNYKHRFKYPVFDEIKDKFTKDIKDNLHETAAGHLNNDHIKDILDYIGVDKQVNKDKITLQEAMRLLHHHKEHGTIGQSDLEGMVQDYALNKEEKKAP